MTDEKDTKQSATDKLLEDAAADWKLSQAAYDKQRVNEVADLTFESGEHYTEAELAWLKEKKAPAIQIDQISGQVAKVTNQPVHRINIVANGGGADPKSAEYWQGVCRRTENLSRAEDVYKWARRHVAIMGRGFWKVRSGYFAPMEFRPDGQYDVSAFQQDIRIEPILHQHSVHEDPRCQQLDFSDMRFCLITSDVEWSEFTRLHPKDAENRDLPGSRTQLVADHADCPPEWATEKSVRVAERYWIEDQLVTLCLLKPGTVIAPGAEPLAGATVVVKDAKGPKYPAEAIEREHTFRIPKVKWMKYIHGRILEQTDVPGRFIPVVKIVGERRIIEGKEDNRGMIRSAKWPARLVDFYESRLASATDLASYDTWKAAAAAVEGHEDLYLNAHRDRPAVLLWNHKDEANEPIPEPQHVTVAPQVQHLVIAAQRAGMNLRHTLGVPDVTPEETRPEQSGRAIRARQVEQAQATSHYGDATAAGIRHTARIIMSMGREVYDAPRILRINGNDGKEVEVVVGAQQHQETMQQIAMEGQQQAEQMRHMLAVDVGDYDVTVSAGKGHDTARQEGAEAFERVLPMLPPEMAVRVIPTYLKSVDAPGMMEMAKKLEPSDESGMVPVEQVQQMQQQAEAVIQAAQQEIAKLQDEVKSNEREIAGKIEMKKIEIEGDMQIEVIKQQAEIQKAQIAAAASVKTAAMQPAIPEFGN